MRGSHRANLKKKFQHHLRPRVENGSTESVRSYSETGASSTGPGSTKATSGVAVAGAGAVDLVRRLRPLASANL